MTKKKIITVVGARPQFVKVGPVSSAMKEFSDVHSVLVHTGQHFDDNMSDVFFRQLSLPIPDYNLDINGGSHAEQTANMLVRLESAYRVEKPDLVLVYGDTNSTLAAALAAAKMSIPIAHVEAGLRSFNRSMPEEVNRILTDHMSSLLFSPSRTATNNLIREGVSANSVFQTGDVMFDAVLANSRLITEEDVLPISTISTNEKYALLTIHRAENTDNNSRLTRLVDELILLSGKMKIVFPLHPRTKSAIERVGRLKELERSLVLISPVGYLDSLHLIKNASIVLTDSGGMQKEAMFLNTPCVTLREETEWLETVDMGANCLYLFASGTLSSCVNSQLSSLGSAVDKPYGQGDASIQIVEHINHFLGLS